MTDIAPLTPAALAAKVAAGKHQRTDVVQALNFSAAEVGQFSVAVMQRASQFSSNPEEAQKVPLNSAAASEVRRHAAGIVAEVALSTSGTPLQRARWHTRMAEYARRIEESKIDGRLSFGYTPEQLGQQDWRSLATEAAQVALSQPEIDVDTRLLLGYEQAYWMTLDKNFAGARAKHLDHAGRCVEAYNKTGDKSYQLGEAICRMQAAKVGFDGKLEDGSADGLLATYHTHYNTVLEHKGSELGKRWMATINDHITQAALRDPSLGQRVESFKGYIARQEPLPMAVSGMAGM